MSTEMDFKALWNKQAETDIPDTKALFAKADNLKKSARNKLIGLNLVLLATILFIAYTAYHIDKAAPTTKIGVALIGLAIISYLVASNQIMPLLFKSNLQGSSQEYLTQLIRIKRKNEFLNKVMINIYFALMSAGLFLYMLQFALRMSAFWAIFWYVVTFAWIAFACFYLRPRRVSKKQKPLNDMIAKLEEVNKQLKGE